MDITENAPSRLWLVQPASIQPPDCRPSGHCDDLGGPVTRRVVYVRGNIDLDGTHEGRGGVF